MSKPILVILPALEIPIGSTVTKRTGAKEYVLKDKVRFFSDDVAQRKEITAAKGVLYLINDGDINIIPADLELIWITESDELLEYLEDEEGS